MKKEWNIKLQYLIIVGVISIFLVVGSFSYALFTTSTEGKGTLNIAAGTLYSSLESSELDKNHSVSLASGETKTVTITLKNVNSIDAKFNLWYTPVEGVTISYDDTKDTPPAKEGETLTVDNKKVYQLNVTNHTSEEQKITFGSDAGLANKLLNFPKDKKEIIGRNLITVLKGKINEHTKSYESATEEEKKEMFAFTHEAGEQQVGWSTEELTDYRYIGTTPNNYVTFNDETWRIIGLFTVENEKGKKEERVKLVRDELIENYSFDNKPSGEGSSDSENGSSYWKDSRLKELLNEGVYHNRESGVCPYGPNNAMIACDFSSKGLTEEAKKMIGKTKWYLGASNYGIIASKYYERERSNIVGKEGRETNWFGEVGLMYPSDYGYAASGSSCLSTPLSNYDLGCATTDWLYHSTLNQWTITPNDSNSYDAVVVYASSHVNNRSVSDITIGVRPSLYLKSDVKVISGDGSRENSYALAM